MNTIRKIAKIFHATPTVEGAGVNLKRVFGYAQLPQFDPFLMLDDFHSDNPNDYLAGFPWHPHRGIETITYILHGEIEHSDSLGNSGIICAGDVQWMTAGSGIVHQEMPKNTEGDLLWGFQLWANLPARHKMMPPRYRDITADQIPTVNAANDVQVKIICGEFMGVTGPAQDIVAEPGFFDITIPPQTQLCLPVKLGHTVFAYIISGSGWFTPSEAAENPNNTDLEHDGLLTKETAVLYQDGDLLKIRANTDPLRFLLLSGRPLREPVAWHGPIVMNTQQELRQAFAEYQNGTFLKHTS